jgi:hypothetical protein
MLSIWPSNQALRRAGHSRARPDRGRVRCSPRTSGERCFDAPKAVRATHVAALKSNRVLPPLPTEGLHRPLRFSITHQCAVVREDGTDREQRDGARQIYEEGIRKSPVPRGQKLWQGIHDHWGEAQVASADAPLNVRCWTKADKGGFWPAMVCPLMTQIGHAANLAICYRPCRSRVHGPAGQDEGGRTSPMESGISSTAHFSLFTNYIFSR